MTGCHAGYQAVKHWPGRGVPTLAGGEPTLAGGYLPGRGEVPTLAKGVLTLAAGTPPPGCKQTENITFPHPLEAGGKK